MKGNYYSSIDGFKFTFVSVFNLEEININYINNLRSKKCFFFQSFACTRSLFRLWAWGVTLYWSQLSYRALDHKTKGSSNAWRSVSHISTQKTLRTANTWSRLSPSSNAVKSFIVMTSHWIAVVAVSLTYVWDLLAVLIICKYINKQCRSKCYFIIYISY